MALNAKVARTAHDRQHVSHLRVPAFGVTALSLTAPGGATSKSYLPPDSEWAAANPPPEGGADDVHFAPERETAQLKYTLRNPVGAITAARLELYGPYQDGPLWTRELTPEECTDGEHTRDWNGEVTQSEHFPDGFVTVEFSPYKLKLVVAGGVQGDPVAAWTYFHVLIADMEFELGERDVLSRARDRTLWRKVNEQGLPAEGSTLELRLRSNIFANGAAEMHNRTDFTEYEALWGKGPQIPLFLKVYLKDSQGQRVESPKALGNTRFLWDWEDVTEDTSRHHATARAFLNHALNYLKQSTHPKGDSCHKDRGGKRGPGADPVFIPTSGYAPRDTANAHHFPFKVEPCPTRTWAAFSRAWGRGHFAGKTGVLLQPSRMAGDSLKVTVQVAYERRPDGTAALDVMDDPPLKAALKKQTGTFQVWRQLDFVKYVKKKAALPNFRVATFQNYYEKAFIRVRSSAGSASTMDAGQYNARFAAHVATQPFFMRAAIDPAVDQHATGTLAVTFRTYAGWKTAVKALQGWSDADLNTWLAGGGAPLATSAGYHGFCDGWATTLVTQVCDQFLSASEGINLLHFQGLHNHESAPGGQALNGFAAPFPSTGRHKCAFVLCAAVGNYGTDANTPEQTVTHEIGHCLFLAHAPDSVAAADIANRPDATVHDNAWAHCTMSYNFAAERKFCGFCLLRLRGWDRARLRPTAAQNART